MNKYKIIADTSCDIPASVFAENNVTLIVCPITTLMIAIPFITENVGMKLFISLDVLISIF